MCSSKKEMFTSPSPFYPSKRRQRSKRCKVQIIRLNRRRWREEQWKNMELKNLKLFLENQSIVEENEKLRKKAHLLHQENLALMSEFQKKCPHLALLSTSLFHN